MTRKRKQYLKKYYLLNRDKIKQRSLAWYEANKEKYLEYRKGYREREKEKLIREAFAGVIHKIELTPKEKKAERAEKRKVWDRKYRQSEKGRAWYLRSQIRLNQLKKRLKFLRQLKIAA